jgi:diguanylate cyclase (GGDEF)-like protein
VNLDSKQEIWRTLEALPFSILIHDAEKNNYRANNQAQNLFELIEQASFAVTDFNHLTLLSLQSKKQISIERLFNDYLVPNTSRRILLKKRNFTLLLNAKCTQVCESISVVILELIENDKDEHYNFDKIISNISTDLIDIQNDDIDKHIDYALKAIGTVCHADRSYLFKFNNDNTYMSNTHEWVNNGVKAFKDSLQDVPKSALPYFFSLMNDTYLFKVSDISSLPAKALNEKNEFQLQNIQSVLCVGLRYGKELVGFIGCDCVEEKREWTDLDLIRLKLVGEIITNALKNINYKQELQQAQLQLINANQKLNELANTDGLTNIANRRRFDKTLENEISRCARQNQPVSLIICDIDYFKLYNDNYGHQQGDEVLKLVADKLNTLCKRQGDLAARYGGEEFALILPATDSEHSTNFATLIKNEIAKLAIEHSHSKISKYLTLSIGFHTITPNKNTTPGSIIDKADKALYKAKEAGRNKIAQFSQHSPNNNF